MNFRCLLLGAMIVMGVLYLAWYELHEEVRA